MVEVQNDEQLIISDRAARFWRLILVHELLRLFFGIFAFQYVSILRENYLLIFHLFGFILSLDPHATAHKEDTSGDVEALLAEPKIPSECMTKQRDANHPTALHNLEPNKKDVLHPVLDNSLGARFDFALDDLGQIFVVAGGEVSFTVIAFGLRSLRYGFQAQTPY